MDPDEELDQKLAKLSSKHKKTIPSVIDEAERDDLSSSDEEWDAEAWAAKTEAEQNIWLKEREERKKKRREEQLRQKKERISKHKENIVVNTEEWEKANEGEYEFDDDSEAASRQVTRSTTMRSVSPATQEDRSLNIARDDSVDKQDLTETRNLPGKSRRESSPTVKRTNSIISRPEKSPRLATTGDDQLRKHTQVRMAKKTSQESIDSTTYSASNASPIIHRRRVSLSPKKPDNISDFDEYTQSKNEPAGLEEAMRDANIRKVNNMLSTKDNQIRELVEQIDKLRERKDNDIKRLTKEIADLRMELSKAVSVQQNERIRLSFEPGAMGGMVSSDVARDAESKEHKKAQEKNIFSRYYVLPKDVAKLPTELLDYLSLKSISDLAPYPLGPRPKMLARRNSFIQKTDNHLLGKDSRTKLTRKLSDLDLRTISHELGNMVPSYEWVNVEGNSDPVDPLKKELRKKDGAGGRIVEKIVNVDLEHILRKMTQDFLQDMPNVSQSFKNSGEYIHLKRLLEQISVYENRDMNKVLKAEAIEKIDAKRKEVFNDYPSSIFATFAEVDVVMMSEMDVLFRRAVREMHEKVEDLLEKAIENQKKDLENWVMGLNDNIAEYKKFLRVEFGRRLVHAKRRLKMHVWWEGVNAKTSFEQQEKKYRDEIEKKQKAIRKLKGRVYILEKSQDKNNNLVTELIKANIALEAQLRAQRFEMERLKKDYEINLDIVNSAGQANGISGSQKGRSSSSRTAIPSPKKVVQGRRDFAQTSTEETRKKASQIPWNPAKANLPPEFSKEYLAEQRRLAESKVKEGNAMSTSKSNSRKRPMVRRHSTEIMTSLGRRGSATFFNLENERKLGDSAETLGTGPQSIRTSLAVSYQNESLGRTNSIYAKRTASLGVNTVDHFDENYNRYVKLEDHTIVSNRDTKVQANFLDTLPGAEPVSSVGAVSEEEYLSRKRLSLSRADTNDQVLLEDLKLPEPEKIVDSHVTPQTSKTSSGRQQRTKSLGLGGDVGTRQSKQMSLATEVAPRNKRHISDSVATGPRNVSGPPHQGSSSILINSRQESATSDTQNPASEARFSYRNEVRASFGKADNMRSSNLMSSKDHDLRVSVEEKEEERNHICPPEAITILTNAKTMTEYSKKIPFGKQISEAEYALTLARTWEDSYRILLEDYDDLKRQMAVRPTVESWMQRLKGVAQVVNERDETIYKLSQALRTLKLALANQDDILSKTMADKSGKLPYEATAHALQIAEEMKSLAIDFDHLSALQLAQTKRTDSDDPRMAGKHPVRITSPYERKREIRSPLLAYDHAVPKLDLAEVRKQAIQDARDDLQGRERRLINPHPSSKETMEAQENMVKIASDQDAVPPLPTEQGSPTYTHAPPGPTPRKPRTARAIMQKSVKGKPFSKYSDELQWWNNQSFEELKEITAGVGIGQAFGVSDKERTFNKIANIHVEGHASSHPSKYQQVTWYPKTLATVPPNEKKRKPRAHGRGRKVTKPEDSSKTVTPHSDRRGWTPHNDHNTDDITSAMNVRGGVMTNTDVKLPPMTQLGINESAMYS